MFPMTDWTVDVYPAYPPLRSSPLLSCLLCLLRVSASSLSARLGPFGVFRWRLEFSLVLSHACSGTLLPPSSLTSFSFLSSLPSLHSPPTFLPLIAPLSLLFFLLKTGRGQFVKKK